MRRFLDTLRRRRIDRDAARWFARLTNADCPDARRAAFARWCAEDPEYARAYRRVELLWLAGADATQRADVLEAARAALHDPSDAPGAKRWWVPALAALAIVAAASLTLWVAWGSRTGGDVPAARYATATGERREVRLSDGSSLLLDTATTIVVRYDARRRKVDLLRGRVQFDVRDNAKDPFEVTADGGTVTDLGTVFQVGIGHDGVDVVLLKGKVSVTTQTGGRRYSASLQPGEQLRYRRGVLGTADRADTLAAEAWTRGQIVANDWSLQRLLTAMNRYSRTKIEIGDPSLRSIRVSGVLRAGDQRALLQALQQGWSIRAHRAVPDEVVLHRE